MPPEQAASEEIPAAPIPGLILNGFLNGHQLFRTLLAVFIGLGILLLHSPYLDLQIPASLVLLCINILLSEHAFRKSRLRLTRLLAVHHLFGIRKTWVFPNLFPFPVLYRKVRFRSHFAEANLNMEKGFYPRWPFFLDFTALLLLLWGTGGLSSAFFPILPFLGFVGAFLTHKSEGKSPLAASVVLAVSLAITIPFLEVDVGSLHPGDSATVHFAGIFWNGLHIAPNLSFEIGDHAFFVRRFIFTAVISIVFLIFTVTMSGRAADAYHLTMAKMDEARNGLDQEAEA